MCSCFRATVIQDRVWYKDDGALTKVLCPEQADDGSNVDNIHTAGSSSKVDCCACGTARYQLTFRGVWSQSIHQNDVVNMSQFRWSSLVGSSHSKHYMMWRFNTLASRGVRDICQHEDTRALEDEIRHQVNCDFALVAKKYFHFFYCYTRCTDFVMDAIIVNNGSYNK